MNSKTANSIHVDLITFDQHSEKDSSTPSLRSSWRRKLANILVRGRSSILIHNNTSSNKQVQRKLKAYADEGSSTRRVEEQGSKKKVSFSKVEIREHVRIIGDHPACSDGLSLSIGWSHSRLVNKMDVDLFERMQARAGKRKGPPRKLDVYERLSLLEVCIHDKKMPCAA